MKKLKLFLPALLLSLLANSQAGQINQINIISFTVKPVLPGTIDSWMSTPGALIMVAQKVPNPRMIEPRLVIQIRSGGAVICGNNAATAKQVDPFDVRTFNTADLSSFLTNCHELKEGTYTICAQFFNIDKVAISREVCKDFRVEATNIEYAPPTLITPDNGKKFTAQELQGVVMFRWTPLVPKPKEPVTYRLKVWQLMQGQTGAQAMRSNQPIVTKDVDNITQATANGIYTGPCKPPYLCDFIWNVQALNRSGKPIGNNNGMSEPYTFGVTEETGKCPANLFPEDKKKFTSEEAKKEMTFRWTPNGPPPVSGHYRMKVWQLMQGQSGAQAMRTNQPIVTKDVDNITSATVSGIWTGPCKPPYLCDFIWTVETRAAAGETGCVSEPTTFSVTEETVKCTNNLFPEDKKKFTSEEVKKEMTFRWTPNGPPPISGHYRLKVWQLMQGQNGAQAMRTNRPIVTKDVDNITSATVSGIYTGPCKPPYLCDFIWTVETRAAAGETGCTSEPTTFGVTEENVKCPENVFPEDKKKFNIREAKESVTFKWRHPGGAWQGENSIYRLKVWQLMQGQTGVQAMKSNQPLYKLDVDANGQADALTDGLMVIRNFYTGPCKPPYLCDFIWNVEMISKDGHTTCTSEPTTFKIAGNDIDIQIDSVYTSCCNSNGVQNVYIKIKNNLSNTVKITNLNIDKVNGVTNVISITGLSPVLPVNIPGLGSQVFTGTIKCIDTARTIRFFVRAEDAADNAITETEVETDTLNCPCDPCRTLGVTVTGDKLTTISSSSNEVTLSGVLNGLDPNKVKKVTIELVYFNITQTGDSNCAKCAENKEWGNFVPPASHSLNGFGTPVLNGGNFGREWTWLSTLDKACNETGGGTGDGGGHDNGKIAGCATCGSAANPTNNKNTGPPDQNPNNNIIGPGTGPGTGLPKGNSFSLPIAVPPGPALSCCGDKIKICIRYTWWDYCCHACDVIRCYEIERKPK